MKETTGSNTMYAYVFEVADLGAVDTEPLGLPTKRSLYSWLRSGDLPSLSYRMKVAHALAQTVLQLHTSGWLHKGLRPQHVLFFDGSDDEHPEKPRFRGPFIAGFEYARVDNPLEMTEDAPSSPEFDLYRHPDTFCNPRPPFRKAFDLFALGCILLEVALWKALPEVLHSLRGTPTDPELQAPSGNASNSEKEFSRWGAISGAKERLVDRVKIREVMKKVAFHAGDDYAGAVELCFLPVVDDIYGDEDPDSSLQAQESIVEKLSRNIS